MTAPAGHHCLTGLDHTIPASRGGVGRELRADVGAQGLSSKLQEGLIDERLGAPGPAGLVTI